MLRSVALGWKGGGGRASHSTITGGSHGHNRPHWVETAMEKGVQGVKGLHGEAEGTHAKYRPQRHVGMLGGKTKAHPSLLP